MKSLIHPAAGAWLLFMLSAIASGALRELLLRPLLNEPLAHQVGTLFVCAVIVVIIHLFVRRLRPTPEQALRIGAGWLGLTVLFEFTVFHFVVGHPVSELLAAYDLTEGSLWPLVLLCELLAPWWFARRLASPRTVAQVATESVRPVAELPSRLPEQYRRLIDKEEIARLPQRQYEGEVSVVNTPEALERAMLDIRGERVLGFDTETRPAFSKGESYMPCLVQIATAKRVYLLQLEQLDCAREMAELMGNPHIVKTGVAMAGDIRQLKRRFPFDAAAVVDLGDIASRLGNTQTGLRNLTALFLGWRMSKGAKTTNWAQPKLSPAQIGYAATDAWAGRELYLCFEKLGLIATEDS